MVTCCGFEFGRFGLVVDVVFSLFTVTSLGLRALVVAWAWPALTPGPVLSKEEALVVAVECVECVECVDVDCVECVESAPEAVVPSGSIFSLLVEPTEDNAAGPASFPSERLLCPLRALAAALAREAFRELRAEEADAPAVYSVVAR